MKKTIIALVATLAVGVASAADLSSVGETGKVVTAETSFDVSNGINYEGASLGGQLNLGAKGSIALDVASDKNFSDALVTATYANGGNIGPVKLVGALSLGRVIDAEVNGAALAVEGQFKLVGPFVGFVGGQEALLFGDSRFTGAARVSTASAGTYVKLGSLVGKVGYGRSWYGSGIHSNGVVASLSLKF